MANPPATGTGEVDVRPVLREIRADPFLEGGIVVHEVQEAVEARYADMPP